MRCLPGCIHNTFLSAAVVWACLALTSCGGTCVAGAVNNGTGTVLVSNPSPPLACPLSTGMGMMNVAVGKPQICEICTSSSRPQHIFVTLNGIQIRSVAPDPSTSSQWLELAPQLLSKPRQIDLLSDGPQFLVQSASIPAGTYRELLLKFSPDSSAGLDSMPSENSCGDNLRNCILMADGRIKKAYFTSDPDSSELVLPLQYDGGNEVAVVPGATVDIRFTLQPEQVPAISPSGGWQIQYVLAGKISISR